MMKWQRFYDPAMINPSTSETNVKKNAIFLMSNEISAKHIISFRRTHIVTQLGRHNIGSI